MYKSFSNTSSGKTEFRKKLFFTFENCSNFTHKLIKVTNIFLATINYYYVIIENNLTVSSKLRLSREKGNVSFAEVVNVISYEDAPVRRDEDLSLKNFLAERPSISVGLNKILIFSKAKKGVLILILTF